MKITESRIRRIIREELLREVSGAAGPGTVPGYDYIEKSLHRDKPVHMINVRHLERALRETLGVQQHGYADDHFHQPGLEDIISGWESLSKRLTEIWSKGQPRRTDHGRGCATCWPDLFILIDLGKCGPSQAYLIPGVSVIPGVPIIVFGDISLEPLIYSVEEEAARMIEQPHRSDEHEEWAEWVGIQADIISEFDNRVYWAGPEIGDLLYNALVFRMPTVVVLPRSSLIEDIDPCEVAKNYQLLREPPPPPDTEDEVELDSASVEVDLPSQQIDIDAEIYDAPLAAYKEPFTGEWCETFPNDPRCQEKGTE